MNKIKREANAIVSPGGHIITLTTADMPWYEFFRNHLHKLPLETAIKAYEAIGYKRKKFKLVEVTGEEDE